ncbi:MAG TPA: TadE/TadG family type IV pilus assembly protein [Candidatus Binataceae bacterium]|nr:TadE/TadG family type IV pilus assembly protein [Candidatus Binataceae bacterium]
MVELAVAVPAIALLLMVVVDFGRFFYMGIAVHSAARAGAQYGSQTLATAADTTGMTNAATTDWNNSSLGLTVTPSQCTCVSSSSNVSACPSNYCGDDAQATFVEVNTQVPVSSVIAFLGIPSSVMTFLGLPTSGNFTSQAIMQVQQ